MSYSSLLSDLITKVRRKASLETSTFITANESTVSDAEITDAINEGGSYIHYLLADTSEDYRITKVLITVNPGEISLTLPSDFMRLKGIDKQINTNADGYVSLKDFNASERNDFQISTGYWQAVYQVPRYNLFDEVARTVELQPAQNAPGTYLVRYTPQYTPLVSPGDSLSLPLNCMDFVIAYAAIQCLIKLNMPCDQLQQHADKLEVMIKKSSARRGQPRRMLNLRQRRR